MAARDPSLGHNSTRVVVSCAADRAPNAVPLALRRPLLLLQLCNYRTRCAKSVI